MSDIGQRKTLQREAIFQIIEEAPGPLSVNEILLQANDKDIQIGIATIYRTVKLLLKSHKILTVNLPDGQVRYEISKLKHHHHFHCTKCSIVIDINQCCMHLHENEIEGHLIQSHEITLFGTCQSCR
jgi:Fur family ferric uptake transcriptional regulator